MCSVTTIRSRHLMWVQASNLIGYVRGTHNLAPVHNSERTSALDFPRLSLMCLRPHFCPLREKFTRVRALCSRAEPESSVSRRSFTERSRISCPDLVVKATSFRVNVLRVWPTTQNSEVVVFNRLFTITQICGLRALPPRRDMNVYFGSILRCHVWSGLVV
jgi:hypothetical protein